MFKIYQNNQIIATVENVVYSKKHPTEDCYIPAGKYDAEIINVASLGKQFSVNGNEIDGLEQVVVVESDGGEDIEGVVSDVNIIVPYLLDIEYRMILTEMGVKTNAV